jgi:hypothetical protein
MFGPHHAVVDALDQVVESNENNNTADIDVICKAVLERPQALEERSGGASTRILALRGRCIRVSAPRRSAARRIRCRGTSSDNRDAIT